MVILKRGNSGIIFEKNFFIHRLSSFTNKCYIPGIPSPNYLFFPEFTVLLQKVSN